MYIDPNTGGIFVRTIICLLSIAVIVAVIAMKNSKIAFFTLTSLICGLCIIGYYSLFSPHPWMATHSWLFEFPPLGIESIVMVCILFVGIAYGFFATKHARQVQAKHKRILAFASILFNIILLVLVVLNMTSMYVTRTIKGFINYKTKGGGYVCVIEIETGNLWEYQFNVTDNTIFYVQQKGEYPQRKQTNIDAIQMGQVVEIQYIDAERGGWA